MAKISFKAKMRQRPLFVYIPELKEQLLINAKKRIKKVNDDV
jgi:hypothetical protein